MSRQRMILMNEKRAVFLAKSYADALLEANTEFEKYHNEALFVAGLMLYLGEGEKVGRHHIRIANTDPSVLRIFIIFLYKYCEIPLNKVRFWLLAYPDMDIHQSELWWMNHLGLSPNQRHKTQIIKGRHESKKLHYGVGNVIVSNTRIKGKIMRWIELTTEDLGKMRV